MRDPPLKAAQAASPKHNPKIDAQRAIEQKRLEAKAIGEALTAALRKTAWTPTQWCQWFVRVIALDQGWKIASLLTRYGLKVNPQRMPSDLTPLLSRLAESDQRALAHDVFLQTWASPHAEKLQRALVETVAKTLKLDLAAIRKGARTPASKGDAKSRSGNGPRPTSRASAQAS